MPRCAGSALRGLRRPIACTGLALLASCAPWMAIPTPAPGPVAPRLQIWSRGRAVVLTDVTFEADSVRGRMADPLGARSKTWAVLPRTEIDSVRLRPRNDGNWFGAGLAAGIVGTFVLRELLRIAASGGT